MFYNPLGLPFPRVLGVEQFLTQYIVLFEQSLHEAAGLAPVPVHYIVGVKSAARTLRRWPRQT
jgi:hypothetical protein